MNSIIVLKETIDWNWKFRNVKIQKENKKQKDMLEIYNYAGCNIHIKISLKCLRHNDHSITAMRKKYLRYSNNSNR